MCQRSNEPPTFLDGHPQRGIGRAQDVMQILQNFGVGERDNLNWNTLCELLEILECHDSQSDIFTDARWYRGIVHFFGDQRRG